MKTCQIVSEGQCSKTPTYTTCSYELPHEVFEILALRLFKEGNDCN